MPGRPSRPPRGAHLADDHPAFGFEIEEEASAVSRWLLFPHELTNLRLEGPR
jgi:hypothetical protein